MEALKKNQFEIRNMIKLKCKIVSVILLKIQSNFALLGDIPPLAKGENQVIIQNFWPVCYEYIQGIGL